MRAPRFADDDVRIAWAVMMRRPEAVLIRGALLSVLLESDPDETCALHAQRGRRTFARELLTIADTQANDAPGKDPDGEPEPGAAPGGERRNVRRGPSRRRGGIGR